MLLAIDPNLTCTGLALFEDGRLVATYPIRVARSYTVSQMAQMFEELRGYVASICEEGSKITEVVCEQPFGPARELLILCQDIKRWARRGRRAYFEYNPSQIRNAGQRELNRLGVRQEYGLEQITDDECDAVMVGLHHLGVRRIMDEREAIENILS